jgi:hypothetical protein
MSDPEGPTNPLPVSVASDGPPAPGEEGGAVVRGELAEVSRLREQLALEPSGQAALQLVVEAARAALENVAEVSVVVGVAGVAWTGLLAQELDALQSVLREGPGRDAADGGVPVSAANLRAEHRWPGFTRRAMEKGAMSVLAVPVRARSSGRAAFTLYSARVNGLDARARRVAIEYAALAGEVLDRG